MESGAEQNILRKISKFRQETCENSSVNLLNVHDNMVSLIIMSLDLTIKCNIKFYLNSLKNQPQFRAISVEIWIPCRIAIKIYKN